jgi:hypothetical protein
MLSYDRAIEIISNFIADQSFKDRRAEIEWLLMEVYPKSELNKLSDEWDLENRDLWKIKEYIDEENND